MDELRGLWRGKRVDNGEWVEGQFIPSNTNDGYRTYIIANAKWDYSDDGLDLLETDIYEVDPSTLGECTGLRDMNGKLIFEGDIVKYKDNCYEIKYLKKYMRFSPVKPGTVFAVFDYTQSEIVGNIHDNPELLKGEANENT